MWKFATLLIALVAVSNFQVAAQTAVPASVTVHLALEKRRYMVGQQIDVAVQIKNEGREAVIVSNVISSSDNRQGYVRFDLTDSAGRQELPQVEMVGDNLAPFPQQPDWRLVLGKWIVLYANDSITSHLTIDAKTFSFLKKPGKYQLSAEYSSAGLAYPSNYRSIGLSAQDVGLMRFHSWSGKVRSDSVQIVITGNGR